MIFFSKDKMDVPSLPTTAFQQQIHVYAATSIDSMTIHAALGIPVVKRRLSDTIVCVYKKKQNALLRLFFNTLVYVIWYVFLTIRLFLDWPLPRSPIRKNLNSPAQQRYKNI